MRKKHFYLLFCLAIASLLLLSCTKPSPEEGGSGTDDNGQGGTSTPEEFDGNRRAGITYQLLVYSFADSDGDGIGDFNGIASKMDYFKNLGVSALWLSPIHPADSYHGYDVTDYDAVNPDYGTMEDFKAMVKTCHDNDIKVYIDYVMNHTGKGHSWFLAAKQNPECEFADYYLVSQNPQADITAGKFPMLNGSGYNEGEWKSLGNAGTVSGTFRFDLDWSGSVKKITVTETSIVDESEGSSEKFLYYGDGECKRFHDDGEGKYHLSLKFESNWGFLIRTSNSSWASGTKFGAASGAKLSFGKQFNLDSATAANIMFESQSAWLFQGVFGDWMPDLNYGAVSTCSQSKAYKAIAASAKGWIDRGVDGFRLDAVKHVYNQVNDNPLFWKTFYNEMNSYAKSSPVWSANNSGELFMVGEALEEASDAKKYFAGLPSVFEFSFWWRLKDALNNGEGRYFVKDVLSYRNMYKEYSSNPIVSTKLSNHDEDRTGNELGRSLAKEKQAAAVLLTSEGKPFIYQGEELGYYGNKNAGDEYVRTPIKWTKSGAVASAALNGKVDNTMLSASISVEAQDADSKSVLNVYRDFAKVRNTYTALANGKMEAHSSYNDKTVDNYKGICCWYMSDGSHRMLVLHNFSTSSISLLFKDDLSNKVAELGSAETKKTNQGWSVSIGANSSVVFKLN